MSHAYLGRRRYRTHSRRVLISPHPVAHVPLTWRELCGFVWLRYCANVLSALNRGRIRCCGRVIRFGFDFLRWTCRWTLGFSSFLQVRLKNVTRTWGWTRANNYTIFIWLYFVSARWFIEIYWVAEQYALPYKTIDLISATAVLAINALKKNPS